MWKTYDSEDFHQFWSSSWSLPELEPALQVSEGLNLLPHDIFLILRQLFDIIWRNKYNVLSELFVDSKGDKSDQLKSAHLDVSLWMMEVKLL